MARFLARSEEGAGWAPATDKRRRAGREPRGHGSEKAREMDRYFLIAALVCERNKHSRIQSFLCSALAPRVSKPLEPWSPREVACAASIELALVPTVLALGAIGHGGCRRDDQPANPQKDGPMPMTSSTWKPTGNADADKLVREGETYLEYGFSAKAHKSFSDALALNPDHPGAKAGLVLARDA